jgi:hypothetical protein
MRSLVRITTPFVLGSFLLACGPVNRTIVFDDYPQPERDSTTPLPSRVVLEKPQLAVDSTCPGGGELSEGERRAREVHFGADLVRLLGSQNATDVDPQARYTANVNVRLQEEHRRNGFLAVRIIVSILLAAGSAVVSYQLAPRGDAITGEDNYKISAAVTGFAVSLSLWNLIFGTLPSRTVRYRSEATVTIRDRATNQPVAQETVSADHEDSFSDYGLPGKCDRASGTALRLHLPSARTSRA